MCHSRSENVRYSLVSGREESIAYVDDHSKSTSRYQDCRLQRASLAAIRDHRGDQCRRVLGFRVVRDLSGHWHGRGHDIVDNERKRARHWRKQTAERLYTIEAILIEHQNYGLIMNVA